MFEDTTYTPPAPSNRGTESPEDVVQCFRELLLNGKIDEAEKLLKKGSSLNEFVVKTQAREAYKIHRDMEQFRTALEIASVFALEESDISAMKIAEWNRLNKSQEYEQAAEWAKKQGLTDVEILRSAKMAYEQAVKENRVQDAIRIMDAYSIAKEELLSFTITEFNRAYDEGDYLTAALLGRRFNLSFTRTVLAAVKSVSELLKTDNGDKVFSLIEQFKLISDEFFEEIPEREIEKFTDLIKNKFIAAAFEQGNYRLMAEFIETTQLTIKPFSNRFIRELVLDFYREAIKVHNAQLNKREVRTARYIRDSFHLFSAPIPFELYATMLQAAETYHETLLKNEDLSNAISFKKEYGIFEKFVLESSYVTLHQQVSQFVTASLEKGRIQQAAAAIQEYSLPREYVNGSVLSAAFKIIENEQFENAGKLYAKFKAVITDEEDKIRTVNAYKELMEKKHFLQAVEFAKWCRLQKSFIDDAALKAWQVEFLAARYDKALDIKERYKIPRSSTRQIAKKVYCNYLNEKDYKMAVHIRRTYRIPISLTEWFVELFKTLFSK